MSARVPVARSHHQTSHDNNAAAVTLEINPDTRSPVAKVTVCDGVLNEVVRPTQCAKALLVSCKQASKLDSEQLSYLTSEPRFCRFASLTGRVEAGNCSTVARWPSHSRVSNTVSPSGNSSAS